MSNVIQFRPRTAEGNYFGDCPHCGRTTGFFNIGREQWCYCDAHQTKWDIGSNVLSSWCNENEEIWQRNAYRFGRYREVEPVYAHTSDRV